MTLNEIRLLNQQLVKPEFRHPKELVACIGAMRAQEYTMVGGRRPLKSGTLRAVEDALWKGELFYL